MRWFVKNASGLYLDVWGGPALPDTIAHPRWVGHRDDATAFTRRQYAYAHAGKYAEAVVVRMVKR